MGTKAISADLELAFDVGHSSIGWAVLQSPLNSQLSSLNLLGCGVVTFGADDCLASKRRDYRRQRRHARSTRQRIARMEKLLAHLGVLSTEQLAAKHQQAGGHSAPWLLAARVLASNGAKEQLLDWPTLWDVLRWYAHNRGYDGNRRWSEADSAEAAEDTEKEQQAIALMTEHQAETMAETLCGALDLKPLGGQQASRKNFKRLNAAFPRRVVEAEVRRLLDLHVGKLPKLDAAFSKTVMEDWQAIPCPAVQLPARYSGGLLFGQLVPRFDNRIITRCPISGDKVPVKNSPEFLRYRWAMQLANIQVAASPQEKLRKLTAEERKTLHHLMLAKGALTEGELKKAVRALPGVARDNLDTMLMHPDAKDALVFDPVQKLLASAELACFWATLPANLQARFRGKLRHGKAITLADLRAAMSEADRQVGPTEAGRDALPRVRDSLAAFDAELQRQLDAQNTRKAKKQPALSRDAFLAQSFDARKALARLSGRAPYARPLLQQAYEQVLVGKDPREDGGCLFRSEEIRQRELHKKLEDQTNNHLVRHRLLILERLLKDLVSAPEFAAGQLERVGQVTIEVNRDLREFSGKTAKEIQMDLGSRLKNFKSVSDKLEKAFEDQRYNGKPVQVTAGLIRKARIAEDLGWQCPYTGKTFEPVHLVSRAVDKDHVIPRSQRPSDSLESLVVTFSEVNKMKGQRTAWQFIQEFGGKPVEGMPNVMLRTPKQYEDFVTKLESFKGHEDDKRRKKRRKDLLLLPKFEDKGFVPRDLTITSQLVRLGAQVIQRFFAGSAGVPPAASGVAPEASSRLNLSNQVPGATPGTARETRALPRIISLPGAVTGAVRKGWRVLGCLSQAAPQILEPTGEPKSKTDIRDLTHLHHALDACVLALAAHSFPNNGSLWEAMVVRSPNAQQKQLLHATGFYEFNAEDKPNLKDLPVELKQQIASRLAEKRVVQHIPADMSGMKVDQTYYRAVVDRNEVSRVPQRIRRRLEAKKRLIQVLTLRLNRLSAKTDRVELAKSIEGHREELQWWLNAEKSAWVLHRVRWTADAGQKLIEGMKKYRAYIRGVIQAKRPPQKPNLLWPLGAKGQSSFMVYELLPREKLLGVQPKQPETSKLKPQKSVMTFSDNFGVAILDHATNPDDKFVIIPWHKVWHRLEELKQKNLHANGKAIAPKVLRIGILVHVPNPRNSQYAGIWMIRGVQANQRDGWLVDISRPDTIDCRKHGKLNVRLPSLIEGGLEILKPSLCGVAQAAPAAATP